MLKRARIFITRRQFYKIAAFALSYATFGASRNRAQVLMPVSATDELSRTVTQYTKAPEDPWLLIHGIRAMGKDFFAADQKALDYLCSHYLRQTSVNGETYVFMPIDYEHHTHCFLSEAVLDAGVPLDYVFRSNGTAYSVADLVHAARALFAFDPLRFDSDTLLADSLAWSLTVFAHTTDPAEDTWINAHGNQIRFSSVIDSAMAVLERGTANLQSAMHNPASLPTTDGVHDFACTGTHLIYGLATCLKFGHHGRGVVERMKPQFDLLIWRLENDLKLIDTYYDQLGTDYSADVERMYRLDMKLKFLGHAFEIINYIRKFKLFEPTNAQQASIDRALQILAEVTHEIALEGIDKYKEDRVLFKLLVGDSCHAYHATNMSV